MEKLTALFDDLTKKLLWAIVVGVFTSTLMAFNNTKDLKERKKWMEAQTENMIEVNSSLKMLNYRMQKSERTIEKHIDNHD